MQEDTRKPAPLDGAPVGPAADPGAPLAPAELAAWRGFLHAHALLVRALDQELQERHGLPLHEYEVLLVLHEADGHRLRMSELADAVLLSQSGLTRLVDRLGREGLVERVRCEHDGRGLFAALTEAGVARLREARPTHLAGVRRLFLDRLEAEDLRALAHAWERVVPARTA
jgi:DNA-binding MarR family transcriptional regulator